VLPDDVRDDETRHRYEITADGEPAGFVTYRDRDGVRTLDHTKIDPAYEGRGLGSRLVRAVLDDLRERGLGLRPVCPFVRAFLDEHREYAELVPAADRARFGLDPAASA
jgi:predicted GNAT family acetyltransferase